MVKKRKSVKRGILIDPRIVFRYAESFTEAIGLVSPQFDRGKLTPIPPKGLGISVSADYAPLLMVDTFALELYFKTLFAMDHREMAWGHDLKDIYTEMKPVTKKRLRENYNLLLEESHEELLQIPQKYRKTIYSFRSYLRQSKTAFPDVRYMFERSSPSPGVKKGKLPYGPLLRRAARKSVLDVMPEWASKT